MKTLKTLLILIVITMVGMPLYAVDWKTQPRGNHLMDLEVGDDYVWGASQGSLVRWTKATGAYKQYTTEDGMATNNPNSLYLDENGDLWLLASLVGLQRFDGSEFTTYAPEGWNADESSVHTLFISFDVDSDGTFWVGSRETGLWKFDGTTWENFNTENSGIVSDDVRTVKCDGNGKVWFSIPKKWDYTVLKFTDDAKGVCSFDGSSFTHYTAENSDMPSNEIHDIEIQADNTVWFASNYHVTTFDGSSFTSYERKPVYNIEIASDGIVWFTQVSHLDVPGLVSFDGSTWTDHNVADLFDYPIYGIKDAKFDDDGTMWLIADQALSVNTLHHYDGSSITNYVIEIGPKSYTFFDIEVDHSNNKWFGTIAGLSMYDGSAWNNFDFNFDVDGYKQFYDFSSDKDGSPDYETKFLREMNEIRSIKTDRDGVVWVGTRCGIRSYDGASWKYHTFKPSYLSYPMVKAMAVDENNVKWFSCELFLLEFDGENYTEYRPNNHFALSMAIDQNGVKWFAENHRRILSSFDGTDWVDYTSENSPLRGKGVSVAVDQDNLVWILTNLGLWSFDGTNWMEYTDKVEDFSKYALENAGPMWEIVVDDDNIKWFTFWSSLVSFDGTSWQTYDEDADRIAFDQNNDVWFASSGGAGSLQSVSKAALMNGATGVDDEAVLPEAVSITGNYPNPFNPSTIIDFTVPGAGFTELVIYNIMGQAVRSLVAEDLAPGNHSVVWNGRNDFGGVVSSGIYISRLKMRDKVATKRMLLMK